MGTEASPKTITARTEMVAAKIKPAQGGIKNKKKTVDAVEATILDFMANM